MKTFVMFRAALAGAVALLSAQTMAALKISILGDSYSTYEGTPGCTVPHYPGTTQISADQQWWVSVIASVQGQLEMNRSQGGSRISSDNGGSFLDRAGNQGLGNPNAIFVFGGMNDDWNNVPAATIESAANDLFDYLDANYSSAKKYFILNAENCTYNRGLKAATRTALLNACESHDYPVTDLDGILGTEDTDMVASDRGHPTATGLAKISAAVIKTLEAHPIVEPPPASDLAELTGQVTSKAVGSDQVFVFTGSGTFKAKRDLMVSRALLVGGGGAGGWTVGGGGGGGGVVELGLADAFIIGAGTNCVITVGSGGSDNKAAGKWVNGGDGGPSTLVIGDSLRMFTALGGGGGAGWHTTSDADVSPTQTGVGSGGGACHSDTKYPASTVPGKGTAGQGHDGGASAWEVPGGGGGAQEAGQAANARGSGSAGKGGEGKACDITGASEVYGSGGGGGAGGNTCKNAGEGGTHAGDGATTGGTTPGQPGDDGFGGGGGGGAYNNGFKVYNNGCYGGAGGSGTVILRVCDPPAAPRGSVAVAADVQSAEAVVKVDYLGAGAASCSVKYAICAFGDETYGELTTAAEGRTVGNEVTIPLESLSPETEYRLKVVLANDQGESFEAECTFQTLNDDPFRGGFSYSGVCVTNRIGSRVALTFKTSGTLTVHKSLKLTRALVVGGGGAGGWNRGGGGGGGGVVEVNPDADVLWHQGDEASITVGAGGDNKQTGSNYGAMGGDGGPSVLAFGALSYTALGGGGGGGAGESPDRGGDGVCSSGGGAAEGTEKAAGRGTPGRGYDGGALYGSNPGGGGGAGGPGGNAQSGKAGDGGAGVACDITNEGVVYGAGGGGGNYSGKCSAGAGGSAWAGSGATSAGHTAERCDGKDGTGSGGGGGAWDSGLANQNKYGGKGGSGVVVLLLALPPVDPQGTVTAVPTDEGGAVAVKIGDLGLGASSATVSYAVALGEGEYGASTLVKSDCALGETVPFELTGLMLGKSYRLKVVIENNLGKSTTLETSFVPQVPGVSDSFAYTGTFETIQLGDSLVIKCLSSGTLTVGANLNLTQALVVGGGGAGGWNRGGGGGGGGVVEVNPDAGIQWHQGDEVSITVGAGGDNKMNAWSELSKADVAGGEGGYSELAFGSTSYKALGGGGGCGPNNVPATVEGGVASGGGAAQCNLTPAAGIPGSGTPGQGYDGGKMKGSDVKTNPGGGGGAGGKGGDADSNWAGSGGAGIASDITGISVTYGAGGGGGANANAGGNAGVGGSAWAGSGATTSGYDANRCNGKDGTGSGGGGGGYGNISNERKVGGKGGSGVVILVVRVPVEKPVCTVDVQPEGTQAAVTVDLGYPGDGASVCDVKYACHIDLKGKGYGELVTAASGKVEGESVAFDLADLVPAHKYQLKVVVTNDLGKERTFEIPFATESSVIGPVSFSVTSARRKGTAVQASFARTQASGAADVTLYAAPSYAGDDPAAWTSSSVVGSFADGQATLADVLSCPLAASVKCIRFACGGEWSEPLLLEELEVVSGKKQGLFILFLGD